jgi:hypothetical protein
LDTETRTFSGGEDADSDRDKKNMQLLIDTTTLTESREVTDQDK